MNQPSIHNEPELLQLLKNGSQSAFTLLFHAYSATVHSTAFTFLNSTILAKEVVQEVFLKIWLKRAEMGDIKSFRNYLFIMARNVIFDRVKKMSYEASVRKSITIGETAADDTEYLIRHHQGQQLLKQAIDQLPPQQKKIYLLANEEGLSHEAIADRTQLSKHTVKKHMALALNTIRRYLHTHIHSMVWLIIAWYLPLL